MIPEPLFEASRSHIGIHSASSSTISGVFCFLEPLGQHCPHSTNTTYHGNYLISYYGTNVGTTCSTNRYTRYTVYADQNLRDILKENTNNPWDWERLWSVVLS